MFVVTSNWNSPLPTSSFWQQRGVMFDDLSEQHIVSLILDSCLYGLKNAYKYKYKSSCKLHMIRLIPTNIIITLINSTCASTTTVHQYLIHVQLFSTIHFAFIHMHPHLSMYYSTSLLSTGGLCHQPLLPRQRGGLGSFWMWRGLAARLILGLGQKNKSWVCSLHGLDCEQQLWKNPGEIIHNTSKTVTILTFHQHYFW